MPPRPSQTFANMPLSDPRRIQIGWGRIQQPEMPFNNQMLLPTELRLRTTKNGLRLSSVPVKEAAQLFERVGQWTALAATEANETLKSLPSLDRFRIRTTLNLSHATSAGLSLFGQRILDYDLNANLVNSVFYSSENMTSTEITTDIYVGRTSIEVFIDGGSYSYSLERKPVSTNTEGLRFWGNRVEVKGLDLYTAKSIWK